MLETEFSEVSSYSVFLSSFYHPRRSIHSFFLPSLCLSVIHLNDPSPHSVSLSHLCIYYFSFSLFFCVPDFWLRRWKSCLFVRFWGFFSKIHFYVKQLIFDITIIKSSPLVICCPHGSAAFFLSDFQHFLPPTIKLGQIIIVRNFLRIHQKLLLINIIIIIILLNMYLTLLTLQNILLHLRC